MVFNLVKTGQTRPPESIKDYASRKDTILICREVGGLGDILMHRMMFEDFAKNGVKVHFACPKTYHEAVSDHPFVDKILDSSNIDKSEYINHYNTTTACGRYESFKAPFSDLHRSDIWAKYCGMKLESHDMHFRFKDSETDFGRKAVEWVRGGSGKPVVAFCPISAMIGKNLIGDQVTSVLNGIRERGCIPFGLHTRAIPEFGELGAPVIHDLAIRQWMSIINASDYVISVDTAAFHMAGGLGKPLVGIFSFADGKVYGKYFDFELVQRHRDDGDWECGPCYNWTKCTKAKGGRKPCITGITGEEILRAFDNLLGKRPFLK